MIKARIKKDIAKIIKLGNTGKGHNKDYEVGLSDGEPVNLKEYNKDGYDYVGMLDGCIIKFKKSWIDIVE